MSLKYESMRLKYESMSLKYESMSLKYEPASDLGEARADRQGGIDVGAEHRLLLIPNPNHKTINPIPVLNLRTTTSQKCAAVPRRARI